jgi:polyisoprenoid-binding protein YceI
MSKEIRSDGTDRYEARGALTLKGVEHDVSVPFRWSDAGKTAQMRGALTLTRTDFNIGTGEWAVGDVIGLEVDVSFELTLVRKD